MDLMNALAMTNGMFYCQVSTNIAIFTAKIICTT
jgi:hypothetical protein